jgi:phosphoenolpyruvate synthase/pyruvate phosphate dikinase
MGSMVTTKWVYRFGDGRAEGRAEMRNLLGGKGANLAEMSHLGLPVPPGFTITTELCTYFYAMTGTIRRSSRTMSARRSARSSGWWGRASASRRIRCWSRCARGRAPRCPA